MGEEVISDRTNIVRRMRTLSLRNQPHKVKTNSCTATSKGISHFFNDERYTTFKDWMFIHREELVSTKVNAYNHGDGPIDKSWHPYMRKG